MLGVRRISEGTTGAKYSSDKRDGLFVSSNSSTSRKPLTRAEQVVHSAAERLNSQVGDALAAVAALRARDGSGELEACADRMERAARDLAVALRELAEERRESDAQ